MRIKLDNGGIAKITPKARELLDIAQMSKISDLHYRAIIGYHGIIAKGNTPNETVESLVKQIEELIVLDNSQTSVVE